MPSSPLPAVDIVRRDDIEHLARHLGPALSLYIPTARHGPETQHGPIRLRNLIRSIAPAAEAAYGAEITSQLVEPVLALADDGDFWQHQADGLAIFTTPAEHRTFRLPIAFAEDAVVAERFRLRPILGSLTGGDVFYVLALAQNSVRVFEATAQSIDELSADSMPSSIDEALRFEDPERQLQSQSVGGGDVRFHGHGAGEELDKEQLARYFRAVDDGLVELLGPTTLPIIVACVEYYLPIYRDVTALANVLDSAVPGNPEHTSPVDLHNTALACFEPIARQRAADAVARYRDLAGTGNTLADLSEISTAANSGRVDTLIVSAGGPAAPAPSDDSTPADRTVGLGIDQLIADAISTGASIDLVPPSLIEDDIAAILRY